MADNYFDKKKVNKKAVAGATLIAAAAGAVAVSPKGRQVIKKVMNSRQNTPDTASPQNLSSWLKNAYAMEESQTKSLRSVIADFKGYEEIEDGLRHHLEVTEKQKEDVRKCLEAIGEKPSRAKEMMGTISGLGQIDMKMFEDKKIKDLLVLKATEHFEEASYDSLAIAAETEGRKAIANTMERIAKEERAMAQWLDKIIPRIVKDELRAGSPA